MVQPNSHQRTSGLAGRSYKIPIGLTVKKKGFKPTERSIGGAQARFRKLARKDALRGANVFKKHISRRAPVGRRGTIPASLNVYTRPFRGGFRGVAFTNYDVAFFQEEGWGMKGGWRNERYPVPKDYDGPLQKMYSYRSKRTGEITWVGRHPGGKAKPYFRVGYEASVPEVERIFASTVRRSFV